MLAGTGYCMQQLGVATDMEYATPNNVSIVEAWGNLQKGLGSQGHGVLVFIGHGMRRRWSPVPGAGSGGVHPP